MAKTAAVTEKVAAVNERYERIDVKKIQPSPHNERDVYAGEKFDGLVASIKEKGVLEPILLRPLDDNGTFELVAGERRWRASMQAGLKDIPAVIRDLSEQDGMECTIIENLQREDLSEIQEARGFKKYLDKFGPQSIDLLAQRSGKLPQYIRRRIRVLELPEAVLRMWESGDLMYSHLELLVRLDDPAQMAAFAKSFIHDNTAGWRTVPRLADIINRRAPALKTAKFPTKTCAECPKNSKVQTELYGFGPALLDDGKKKGDTLCYDPNCFKHRQNDFLLAHWKETAAGKKFETNGFRFDEGLPWNGVEAIQQTPKKQCLACNDFISVVFLSGEPDWRNQACAKPECFRKTYIQRNVRQQAPSIDVDAIRREFFHNRIEAEMAKAPTVQVVVPDLDPLVMLRANKLMLHALVNTDHALAQWFQKKYAPDDQQVVWYSPKRWTVIDTMGLEVIESAINAALGCIIAGFYDAEVLSSIGALFGVSLKDWVITSAYLNKKDEKGLRALAREFGIMDDPIVQEWLKKQTQKAKAAWPSAKLENLDRAQLKDLFLKSGFDLAGKVPKEILGKQTLWDELDAVAADAKTGDDDNLDAAAGAEN